MNNITSLAIDLSKNVFQLHGTDMKGKAILKKQASCFPAPCHPWPAGV